jgi:PIN domain nuclease of toxin-antitoxin system
MDILDTQLLIWSCHVPERLPPKLASRLEKFRGFYFSLASIWEVSIKSSLGEPGFQVDVGDFHVELLKLGFTELPIAFKHIQAAGKLPWLHRDPFDRLLVAAAGIEAGQNGITRLMTVDATLLGYGGFVVAAS